VPDHRGQNARQVTSPLCLNAERFFQHPAVVGCHRSHLARLRHRGTNNATQQVHQCARCETRSLGVTRAAGFQAGAGSEAGAAMP
jgi:hypothetical protein